MCGRYRLSRRKQILAEHFDAISDAEDWIPRYDIAPTQPIPVVGGLERPERQLDEDLYDSNDESQRGDLSCSRPNAGNPGRE